MPPSSRVRDRLSFMRFLGLELGDRVPDAKTIWLFREQLVRAGAMDQLFERFDTALHDAGYLAMGGQIIDATVVAVPRQKLTDEEKATVRSGGTPSGWSKAKRRQGSRCPLDDQARPVEGERGERDAGRSPDRGAGVRL